MKKKILLISAISTLALLTSCDKKTEKNQANGDSIPVDSIEITDVTIEEVPVPDSVVGTYEGTMPCADCEGIKTHLELNKDKTFKRTQEYLGKSNTESKKPVESTGTFKVTKDNHVVLTPDSTEYVIGVDQLSLVPVANSSLNNSPNFVLTKIKIKGDKEKIEQEVIDSTGKVIDKNKEKIKVK